MEKYLSFIKFAHTVFALPFALVGYFLAVKLPGQAFDIVTFLLVLACMVFARSSAMAFNRYIDRHIDARNERTAGREIPSGKISESGALLFVLLNSALFVVAAYLINQLCFVLSPLALIVILGYSYTKRFTSLSHLILGLGLGLAPIGAYIAVTGEFALTPILLGVVVLLWVSGFDIIYALQDREFDASQRLHSVPVRFGSFGALMISTLLHLLCALLLIYFGLLLAAEYEEISFISWIGIGIFVVLLGYQHLIVSPNDLSRVNLAFFTTNGIASIILGTLLIADFYF